MAVNDKKTVIRINTLAFILTVRSELYLATAGECDVQAAKQFLIPFKGE